MNDVNASKEGLDADLLVLGAGPAGLAAAQYGGRANLRVLAVEEMAPGGQALNIDSLENYPGNVAHKDLPVRSGFELSGDFHKQAEQFGAGFIMEGARSLSKEGDVFTLTLSGGKTLRSQAVILATGAKHRKLEIPGEEQFSGRGVSYCATCDGPFFKGKRILVVGGGDSACDEAQYLSRLSDRVILIHRKNRFRAQRALAERVLTNPHIEVRFNSRLLEIRGDKKVSSVLMEIRDDPKDGKEGAVAGTREMETDAVFVFVGALPQTDLVRSLNPQFDESGYVVTDQRMATSVPGLFAAGDVRSSPFRQVVVAAGEGAVAAHCAALYLDTLRGEAYR